MKNASDLPVKRKTYIDMNSADTFDTRADKCFWIKKRSLLPWNDTNKCWKGEGPCNLTARFEIEVALLLNVPLQILYLLLIYGSWNKFHCLVRWVLTGLIYSSS